MENRLTNGPSKAKIGTLVLNAEVLDQWLTIDFSEGNPIPIGGLEINFDDTESYGHLVLKGAATNVTHYTLNASQREIRVDGRSIRINGHKYIDDELIAENRWFTFGEGNQKIELADDGRENNDFSYIRETTTGTYIPFRNPTRELRVDGGRGDDSLFIREPDLSFAATITVSQIQDNSTSKGVRLSKAWQLESRTPLVGRITLVGRHEAARFELQIDGSPWQNPINPFDVVPDGVLSSADALAVINHIHRFGQGKVGPRETTHLLQFVDVNGDGAVTTNDVLRLFNAFADHSSTMVGAQFGAGVIAAVTTVATSQITNANSIDTFAPLGRSFLTAGAASPGFVDDSDRADVRLSPEETDAIESSAANSTQPGGAEVGPLKVNATTDQRGIASLFDPLGDWLSPKDYMDS